MAAIFPSSLSVTDSDNTTFPTTDGGTTNIAEDCPPSGINNALRSVASMLAAQWGGMYSGTSRPAEVQAGTFWRDTSAGAAAEVIYWYDGADDIAVVTVNATANTVSFAGNITGDVTGNVTGDLTGNADTATALDSTALASAGISDVAGLASQAEAEAGTDNTKMMTPLRTAQAIAALSWTEGTEQAASGTAVNFTGIPAGVKHIVFQMVGGVSTNGTSNLLLQIGDSGGLESSGYSSTAIETVIGTGASSTAGFLLTSSTAATQDWRGTVVLTREDSANNTWVASGSINATALIRGHMSNGDKSLSAALDRITLTTVGGTDTFDAGSINIQYTG